MMELGLTKTLKNSFKIGNEDIIIHLSKGSTILSFDRVIKTKNAFVSEILESEVKFDILKFHISIGHCGEEALRITAKS
jgi:hypothetical protein